IDVVLRADDHICVELPYGGPTRVRSRSENLHRHISLCCLDCTRWKVSRREQVFPNRVVPIDHEHCLQESGCSADKAHLSVAPKIEALAAIDVFLADVHSAGITDHAVHYCDLAMIAVAEG